MYTPVEKPCELSEQGMTSRRTEWLENQERKLTATVNQTLSVQQGHSEQIAVSAGQLDNVTRETKRLSSEHERTAARTQQLYMEQQWVYGKTSRRLLGIDGSKGMARSLKEYRDRCKAGTVELIDLTTAGKTVLLSYPMEKVDTENGHQYLMKMKVVDKVTGQLSHHWAIVYEIHDGRETRPISDFSLVPH